jgi:hypothetical protein
MLYGSETTWSREAVFYLYEDFYLKFELVSYVMLKDILLEEFYILSYLYRAERGERNFGTHLNVKKILFQVQNWVLL